MLRGLRLFFFGVVLAQLAGAADAFKCTGADGAVSFQDKPCKTTAREQRFELPETVDAPLPTRDAANAEQATTAAAPPIETSVAPPQPTAPSFIVCTRDDGTRYRNDSGHVPVHLVPVEIARPTPRSIGAPASNAPIGGGSAYTQVADECHLAAPAEACTFLRGQLEQREDEIRHSFHNTTAENAAEDLRDQLRGCR